VIKIILMYCTYKCCWADGVD